MVAQQPHNFHHGYSSPEAPLESAPIFRSVGVNVTLKLQRERQIMKPSVPTSFFHFYFGWVALLNVAYARRVIWSQQVNSIKDETSNLVKLCLEICHTYIGLIDDWMSHMILSLMEMLP